eukprot:3074227-Rhodomonas_salina.1
MKVSELAVARAGASNGRRAPGSVTTGRCAPCPTCSSDADICCSSQSRALWALFAARRWAVGGCALSERGAGARSRSRTVPRRPARVRPGGSCLDGHAREGRHHGAQARDGHSDHGRPALRLWRRCRVRSVLQTLNPKAQSGTRLCVRVDRQTGGWS